MELPWQKAAAAPSLNFLGLSLLGGLEEPKGLVVRSTAEPH